MNKIKKAATVILAILMVVSCSITVFAATQITGGSVKQGEQYKIVYPHTNIDSLDGEFIFSKRSIFSSVDYSAAESGLMGTIKNDKVYLFSDGKGDISGKIILFLTVSPTATVGDTCTITFKYRVSSDGGKTMSEDRFSSTTVTVAEADTSSTPGSSSSTPGSSSSTPGGSSSTPGGSSSTPGGSSSTPGGSSSTPGTSSSKPGTSSSKPGATTSKPETTTSKPENISSPATGDTSSKPTNTTGPDYTRLQEMIDAAASLESINKLGDLWIQLNDAVKEGKALFGSNNQALIDASADKIEDIINQIKAILNEYSAPNEVIKEVEVEVPPKDDYCNISIHKVWPILFFISLAINICLGALIVYYFMKKRSTEEDDIPLVDYDISDDDDFTI